jgi:hypothetical protein
MCFNHLYDLIQNINCNTMNKTLTEIQKMIFGRASGNERYLCLDYEKFDTTISSVDIHRVKQTYGKQYPEFYNTYMDYEDVDYPLLDSRTGTMIIQKADKLMTGDYLTAILSIAVQMSNYDYCASKGMIVDPKAIIGDDAVIRIPGNMNVDRLLDTMNDCGSRANKEKSMVTQNFVTYNRRI